MRNKPHLELLDLVISIHGKSAYHHMNERLIKGNCSRSGNASPSHLGCSVGEDSGASSFTCCELIAYSDLWRSSLHSERCKYLFIVIIHERVLLSGLLLIHVVAKITIHIIVHPASSSLSLKTNHVNGPVRTPGCGTPVLMERTHFAPRSDD